MEFLDGTIENTRRDGIRTHVDSCHACLRIFAALASEQHSQGHSEEESANDELEVGQNVGRFVVLHLVGAGGMGRVYAVYDPELDRKVALKLLHSAGGAANERLLKEARVLAKLSHPNVISIFDVGRHGEAVYLAMEYIEGPALMRHFEGAEPKAIIEYFVDVAKGLAAAHRQGIVHRDIKPANLLVGADARAVAVDFGLASGGTSSRVHVAGTRGYMAPEQLEGHATAQSDQYSYCVSLLQVLTGELYVPGQSLPKSTPPNLRKALERGLSNDPRERFSDMQSLADALAPVDRRGWLVPAIVALAAAGALGFALWPSAQEEGVACSGAERLLDEIWNTPVQEKLAAHFGELPVYGPDLWQRASARFSSYQSQWVGLHKAVCQATRVYKHQSEAVMDQRMQCLSRRKAEFAALVFALDSSSVDEAAKVMDAQALLIPPSSCASPDTKAFVPDLAETRDRVAGIRSQGVQWMARAAMGQLDAPAEGLHTLDAQAREIAYRPLEAEIALSLGNLLSKTGKYDEAERALRRAIATGTESRHDAIVADAWLQLSWLHGYQQERYAEADVDLQNGLAFVNRISATGILPMSYARNKGWLALRQGHLPEALENYEAALSMATKLGTQERDVAMLHSDLGSAHISAGNIEKAAEHFGIAFQTMSALLGAAHPDTLSVRNNYALLLKEEGKVDEAITEFRAVLKGFRSSMQSSEAYQGQVLNNLATIYADKLENTEAEKLYREALDAMAIAYPDGQHANIARALHGLATVLLQDKRYDEAEEMHSRSLAMKEALLGPSHPSVAISLSGIADLYVAQGQVTKARRALVRAIEISTESYGREHPQTEYLQGQLGELPPSTQ